MGGEVGGERRLVRPLVDDRDGLLVVPGGVDAEVEVAAHGPDLVALAVELGEGGGAIRCGGAQVEYGDEHGLLLTTGTGWFSGPLDRADRVPCSLASVRHVCVPSGQALRLPHPCGCTIHGRSPGVVPSRGVRRTQGKDGTM